MASDLDFGECKDWRLFYRDHRQRRRSLWEALAFIVGVLFIAFAYTYVEGAPLFKGGGSNGEPMSLRLLDEAVHRREGARAPRARREARIRRRVQGGGPRMGGRTWAACWIELRGQVLAIDEEGAPLNPPNGVPAHGVQGRQCLATSSRA